MGILVLLIPAALLLSATAVGAYIWACKNRQFEDLDSPAYKMLFDDQLEAQQRPQQEQKPGRLLPVAPGTGNDAHP